MIPIGIGHHETVEAANRHMSARPQPDVQAQYLMRQACLLVEAAERMGFRLTITRVPVAPLSMGRATGLVEIWRHNNDQFDAIGFAPGLEG